MDRTLRFYACVAFALLALHVCAVDAFGSRKLQQCKRNGSRCSLYAENECCGGLMCTMPLECTSKSDRGECQPECRAQTLKALKNVTYPSGSGFAWGLEGGRKDKPAVIVMQEWWGVNKAIIDTAMHIAEQGYRVLIPDLYDGRVALDRMEAVGLSSDLNWTTGVQDVVAAAKYLRATGAKKVAIVGFCQGGAVAFCGAEFGVNPDGSRLIDAAIPFYGIPANFTGCNPTRIAKTVPIQAHFGTLDTSFPPSRYLPLRDSMLAEGINIKLYQYPGLPHAFFNAITPEGRRLFLSNANGGSLPDEAEVVRSFSRFTNFLRQHIRRA